MVRPSFLRGPFYSPYLIVHVSVNGIKKWTISVLLLSN